MNNHIVYQELKEDNINLKIISTRNYMNIIIFCLASVFFARVFTSFGLPNILNFVHYGLIFIFATLMILQLQTLTSAKLLLGLFLLFGCINVSAIINDAGVPNIILDSLILIEPFLFLYLLSNKLWTRKHINLFRKSLFIFASINVVFSLFQFFVLGFESDNVRGVFLGAGAGAHVNGAVTLSTAVYFINDPHFKLKFIRYGFFFASFLVIIFTDDKQTLLVFLLSLLALLMLNIHKVKKLFSFLIILIITIFGIYLLSSTLFPAIMSVAGDINKLLIGIEQKFSVFNLLKLYHTSFLNTLFGLGPGHTVGRLGQMLPEYNFLENMGATTSSVTNSVWHSQQGHWISNSITGSSMWSLFFSWSGVWGDLGYIGFLVYVYLWFFVFQKFCVVNLSKFLLVTIIVHGVVYQWIEEPAYILFVVSLIANKYQETRMSNTSP